MEILLRNSFQPGLVKKIKIKIKKKSQTSIQNIPLFNQINNQTERSIKPNQSNQMHNKTFVANLHLKIDNPLECFFLKEFLLIFCVHFDANFFRFGVYFRSQISQMLNGRTENFIDEFLSINDI